MTDQPDITTLLDKAKVHVRAIFDERPNSYTYHNYSHTEYVVNGAESLAKAYDLSEHATELLLVAAYFHDIAYTGCGEDHEQLSAEQAAGFLKAEGATQDDIDFVRGCILATRMGAVPKTLPQMILKDADCKHLSRKKAERKSDLLRMEWELTADKKMDESEWLQTNIDFLKAHQYYTTIARNEWEKPKQKLLVKAQKRLAELDEASGGNAVLATDRKPVKKSYSRGVETMFRVTLRNHIHLSKIADNKANFLLSISAIILSLLLGNLITDNKPVAYLMLPSIYFLLVCIVTMILAILATRPNITKGKFSREALLNKDANILFFGNFHSMPLDDFDWGMERLMENDELLYHSLTTDLYFLGKVLHKKYQYLRVAFQTFMIGLISTAVFYLIMIALFRP